MTLIHPGFVFETPERVDPAAVGIMSGPIQNVIGQYQGNFRGTPAVSGPTGGAGGGGGR
jgi:hypothetical protein